MKTKIDAEKLSIVDVIGYKLRNDIIEGKLAPGEQLIEVDLAQTYDASRNSIREVLHLLVRDGLATAIRHRGVFVRKFHVDDLQDLYTARRTLELHAVRSSPPPSRALLNKMARNNKQAERALAKEQWQEVGSLSLMFHQLLVSMLGSKLLDEFFLTLCAQLRLVFFAEPDEKIVQAPLWIEWERRIHQCLCDGDIAQAEHELAEYLDASETALSKVVSTYQNSGLK